jgi:hypothetical protein
VLAVPPPPSWDALKPIEGSVLFACQSEPGTGDLYFKDDGGTVHRLTVTERQEGAGLVTWYGNRILAVIDRGLRNRMEIRDLTTRPDAVGARLGPGWAPAASPTGTIAYTRVGEDRKGRLVDEVIGKGADILTISSRRRVAYSHGRRVTVMRLDGSHRHVFARDWTPWAWSPGGRRILVSGANRRVGLMNARTGAVRRLGRLPCGYLTSAEWTAPGRHPWPGDPR